MRKHRVLAIALLGASVIYAQEQTPPAEEQNELAELMSIVEQETEVATKTRMNSDYVPGIVTVLEGEELEALGIATAADALSLVPGMQATRDSRSSALVIVRGLDFPFNSGNIQILINGFLDLGERLGSDPERVAEYRRVLDESPIGKVDCSDIEQR